MSRVTEHYGIDGPVPFVNVHVERDSPIFLDPSAIRNDPSPRGVGAYGQLRTMFSQVVEAARSSNPHDHQVGRQLLNHLHEPNETRLGLSIGGSHGRGFAYELETQFWDALRANPSCQHAVLNRVEDTRLYVDYVGDDRISDMTTRIIFNVLADFTTEMMSIYPALNAGATTAKTDTWSDTAGWQLRDFELPHCAGKQLLLVPREWVYWRTLMDPIQFYNRYSTQVIQDETATYSEKGKRHAASKASIKQANPHIRTLNNDKAVEYKAEHGRDLTEEYRNWIDFNFAAMTTEDISKKSGG